MPRSFVFATLVPVLCPALFAQTNWFSLTSTTPTLPTARTAHAMAYDVANDRCVLFGGTNGTRMGDTWLFDGTTWLNANPPVAPPARVAHAIAYDFGRARAVVFGGIPAAGGLLGDTWEWDGATWTQMTPLAAPSARRSQPMAYYPPRATVILWGGYSTTDLNDTWEWDGQNWSQIVTLNSPSARRASDMAYDPTNSGLVLFSGYLQTNDTWLFDGIDWRQLTPATSPAARYDHSMCTDMLRNRIVMYGGPGAADSWEWDGTTWLNRATATLPPARSDSYLAYDWVRERTLMFAGIQTTADFWAYRPVTSASYTVTGNGCPGTNAQAPRLSTSARPWLGASFDVTVDQLPTTSLALMTTGFSNTFAGSVPLPLDLSAFGLTGCTLYIDPVLVLPLANTGGSANWSLAIPTAANLLGVRFFNQAAVLDIGANAAGITTSNAGAAVVGGM